MKNVSYIVSIDGKDIKKVKKLAVVPSEMETITLKKEELIKGSKLELRAEVSE